jgi:nucleotide-binding universal stress UspA family protein
MAALEWASAAANDTDSPLRLVHASGPLGPGRAGQESQDAKHILAEAETFARAAGAHVEITTHCLPDDPGRALVAESERASLVVVASHGHSRMHDTFISSVSLYTAMHARCPVVVIRPYRGPAPDRVVVGIDGSPLSLGAARFAFAEARRLGRGVTAVHTWLQPVASGHDTFVPMVTDLDALQRENEALLSESLADLLADCPDVDVRKVTVQNTPAAALIEASMDARLLVVGSRGRSPFAGLLLGSTSQAVLHRAGCPVAIVHTSGSTSGIHTSGTSG